MGLSAKDIQTWVGNASFAKGRQYFEDGAVFHTARQGEGILAAKCRGSRGAAYEQRITLDQGQVKGASCTCPVGVGGQCKHVAAVLLTWVGTPAAFAPEEPLPDRLAGLTEAQLRRALGMLLERDGDLAWVLDVVAGPATVGGECAVDSAAYCSRALAAMPDEHGWRGTAGAARALSDVADIGEQFLGSGQAARAAAAFIGAIEAGIGTYEQYEDETQISYELTRCVEGLADCLAELPEDAPARAPILDALFAAFEFHCSYAAITLEDGIAGILRQQATAAERQAMAKRCRDLIARGGPSEWRSRELGEFLLELEVDSLDDEAFLRLCRETGREVDLVDRLLALGRQEEAAQEARRLEDHDLLCLEGVYRSRHRADAFVALLVERAPKAKSPRIWEWLREHWAEKGEFRQALEMARREFEEDPSEDCLTTCVELGAKCGLDLDGELLQWLRDHGQHAELTRILLDRGRHGEAAALFAERKPTAAWRSFLSDLDWADRFAASRPDVALPLYRTEARRLRSGRGRDAYRRFADCLAKWRGVCRDDSARQYFDAFLAGLAPELRRLPALRDELQSAGVAPFSG